jgi:hypothetical protein
MHEFAFRRAHVVNHADQLKHFFLQVNGESILHEKGRSLAQVVHKDASGFVRVVREYCPAIDYDETVDSHLVLGGIEILLGTGPLSRDLSK